jgi:hypothetical protein
MISSHAVNGTRSAATFSLLVHMGGRKAVALVDSGSTYSFIDCTIVSRTNCNIISTANLSVSVAGGRGYIGYLCYGSPYSLLYSATKLL